MTTMKKSAFVIAFAVALTLTSFCRAQVVVHYPGSANQLSERWKWSRAEINQKRFDHGCWVGYSIQHHMGKKSFIGTFRSDWGRHKATLEELLTGLHRAPGVDEESAGLPFQTEGTTTLDDEEKEEGQVIKEVGLLFHVGADGAIDELRASNLSLPFDFAGGPLLWLGTADHHESESFIESLYGETKNTELKKSLIMALGIHEGSKEAFDFLKAILLSSESTDIREDAAFWLGQTGTDDARNVLLSAAQNDRSESVREKAVFSISQMRGLASVEAIITIAKLPAMRVIRGMESRD